MKVVSIPGVLTRILTLLEEMLVRGATVMVNESPELPEVGATVATDESAEETVHGPFEVTVTVSVPPWGETTHWSWSRETMELQSWATLNRVVPLESVKVIVALR
jgi:hypothetical protein